MCATLYNVCHACQCYQCVPVSCVCRCYDCVHVTCSMSVCYQCARLSMLPVCACLKMLPLCACLYVTNVHVCQCYQCVDVYRYYQCVHVCMYVCGCYMFLSSVSDFNLKLLIRVCIHMYLEKLQFWHFIKSSNSNECLALINFMDGCLIFNWVREAWLHDKVPS